MFQHLLVMRDDVDTVAIEHFFVPWVEPQTQLGGNVVMQKLPTASGLEVRIGIDFESSEEIGLPPCV